MSRTNTLRRFLGGLCLLIVGGALLSACGGGGSSTPAPVATQSGVGVWQSSYVVTSGANTGNTIKGLVLISPTQTFYAASINQSNGCAGVAFGQAAVTGSSLTGAINSYVVTYSTLPGVNVNCAFPDGTTSASGTISGTVFTGQTLVVTDTGTTSRGLALGSTTTTMTWSPLNAIAPSLALASGNYTPSNSSASTMSIASNGAISTFATASGCTGTGQLSIPSATNNIYNISIVLSGCSQAYAILNGVTLSGLATYDNTVTPNQLNLGMSARVNGQVEVLAVMYHK